MDTSYQAKIKFVFHILDSQIMENYAHTRTSQH